MGKMKNMMIELHETTIMEACSECQGTGTVEVEVARPQSFSRDVGEIDVEIETCDACDGGGEVERLCDCGDVVTKVRVNSDGGYIINSLDHETCEGCTDDS